MVQMSINSSHMKKTNASHILDLLSLQPMSRIEISRRTKLTRASVTILIDSMIQMGLVTEGDDKVAQSGRRVKELRIRANRYVCGGVYIDRDFVKIGLIDFSGKEIFSQNLHNISEYFTEDSIISYIINEFQNMLYYKGTGAELLGIGIITPGPINTKTGQILKPPHFERWWGVNIVKPFADRFSCPVFLEKNSNAMALAERRYFQHGRHENFMELYVGNGIGSGLILEGQLYDGGDISGVEIGHTSINFDGPPCDCGNTGCAEIYASLTNIVKYARTRDARFTNWKTIVQLAYFGVEEALNIIELEARYLSMLVVNCVNLLNVEAVILCGQITDNSEFLISLIQRFVDQRLFVNRQKSVEVLCSKGNFDNNILAAANIPIEAFLGRRKDVLSLWDAF